MKWLKFCLWIFNEKKWCKAKKGIDERKTRDLYTNIFRYNPQDILSIWIVKLKGLGHLYAQLYSNSIIEVDHLNKIIDHELNNYSNYCLCFGYLLPVFQVLDFKMFTVYNFGLAFKFNNWEFHNEIHNTLGLKFNEKNHKL